MKLSKQAKQMAEDLGLSEVGKSPSIQRDCLLVEHAFITMRRFVEIAIQQKGINDE